jgi:hypothetical protein
MDRAAPIPDDTESNRRRATLAILPFLLLGLADVVLIIGMGLRPLWAFLLLPPILFVTVIGWIAFKTGFVRD